MGVLPWRAAVAGAYMAAIAALSSVPPDELASFGLSARLLDLAHVPLFAGLASVTLWALVGPRLRCALAAAVLCAAFAVTDEWCQQFVPGRVPSLDDLVADGAGILIGLGVVVAIPRGRLTNAVSGAVEHRGDSSQ